VVRGCPVKIEGIPNSDMGSQGGVCAKGLAAIMDYQDPNRCNHPVIRTNPKKGLEENPEWRRISWHDALDTISEKLQLARKKDSRTILVAASVVTGLKGLVCGTSFFNAIGASNWAGGGVGAYCGNANDKIGAALTHASVQMLPDYKYCNYHIRCGGAEGITGGRMPGVSARQAAAARDRGMKMVVVDPIGYTSAGKATEWVPILPATDSALFLSMANLIVNEIGIYDKRYIRKKTNGPYLVGPDRLFVRDKQNGRPVLWDEKDGRAKTFDDPTLAYPALEGNYVVYGINCQPAFELLKGHLRKYSPAWASEISTIPEKTIRRLAKELVEQARVGSTIEIEGARYPYRPACVVGDKGASSHQNAYHQTISLILLNTLLGNHDVPGGVLGTGMVRSLGYPETGCPWFEPYAGCDGMLTPGVWLGRPPWPPSEVAGPSLLNFSDIFAHSPSNVYPYCDDWDHIWSKAGRPYEPEVLALYGGNVVMNSVNPKSVEEFLKKIPFIFSINTIHNETTEGFADIVLPECHFLENIEIFSSIGATRSYPTGLDKWSFHVTMPVVEPKYERRNTLEIFYDLADKVGVRSQFNIFLENMLPLKCMKRDQAEVKEYKIVRPDERVSATEFVDRTLSYYFGKKKGLKWFRENGFVSWKKRPEECYWRYFVDARVPIYYEWIERDKEKIRERAEQIGIHMKWANYTALPSYFSSVLYDDVPSDSEFNLIAISYRDPLHTQRFGAENPWIDEMSLTNPYTYSIVMNVETARRKAIKEGDVICVESHWGGKVKGRAKLALAVHPQVIAMVPMGGWARRRPIARGKGTHFNELLRGDHRHVCPVSGAFELGVKVKTYRYNPPRKLFALRSAKV
jgi:molybdopterin-containing oxidoreductase family molybdopterin binding subunit